MPRIPFIQRHVASPDPAAKTKPEKAKTTAKQKEEEQPQIVDADERLLSDIHGQAIAAVDKIVCMTKHIVYITISLSVICVGNNMTALN